jgi:hypothetical protein
MISHLIIFWTSTHANHIFPDRCSMLPLPCSPPQGALLADGLSPPFELGALLWPLAPAEDGSVLA